MKYMLDTNICIYLIKHQPREVKDKFRIYSQGCTQRLMPDKIVAG